MSRLGAFRNQAPAATTTAQTSAPTEEVVQQTETVSAEAPQVAETQQAPATVATRRLGGAGVKTSAPAATGKRLSAAKTTGDEADTVDTTEDAPVAGRKPLVILGSAKRRQPAEERVIEEGARMPINMVHDMFHDYVLNSEQFSAQEVSKKDTTAIFKLVEEFMQDVITKHPVQFMGLLFRHKPVAERFYAPRISDFVTYVGAHTQIEAKDSIVAPMKAFLMNTPEGVKVFEEQAVEKVVDGKTTTVIEKVQNDDLQYLVEKYEGQQQA
jgi:hypothetical protein